MPRYLIKIDLKRSLIDYAKIPKGTSAKELREIRSRESFKGYKLAEGKTWKSAAASLLPDKTKKKQVKPKKPKTRRTPKKRR